MNKIIHALSFWKKKLGLSRQQTDIKPGSLFQFNPKAKERLLSERNLPRFCPVVNGKIRNDVPWKDRALLASPGTLLLFVEPLDYSKETASVATAAVAWAAVAWAAVASAAAVASSGMTSWASTEATEWRRAENEFRTMGRIPGGIFLAGNGKLIWLSHFDLEHFEEKIND